MHGFKNLIARRRPVSKSLPPASAEPAAGSLNTEVDTDDPWKALQETTAAGTDPRACDIDSARAARNHVPRPGRPQPLPRKEWEPVPPDAAPNADSQAPQTPRSTSAPKIWDLDPPAPAPPATPTTASGQAPSPDPSLSALARSAAEMAPTASPAASRPASERIKTRLLGFHTEQATPDPMAAPAAAAATSAPRFPIGWVVVIDGPGRGASFALTSGLSTVGRDANQTVTLDFGDTSISREGHISIAHDDEDNRTYIGHGGKSNIVRQNDKPLLTTEELRTGDTIRIGKTVLRFVGLCGDDFSWTQPEAD